MAWGRPYRDLADELTADDLVTYEAWYSIEPFGGMPEDIRTAIIAHTSAAVMSKNAPSFEKFIPRWETAERLDATQTNQMLRDWAKAVNRTAK